jgi:hypothetical protein
LLTPERYAELLTLCRAKDADNLQKEDILDLMEVVLEQNNAISWNADSVEEAHDIERAYNEYVRRTADDSKERQLDFGFEETCP